MNAPLPGDGGTVAASAGGLGREHESMYSPVVGAIKRAPLTCAPETPLREVLAQLDAHKVGSMVVVDPATRAPLGIFTLRDLLKRVALAGRELDRPVAEVMTRTLVTVGPKASSYQAALTMAGNAVRHLLVVDAGRLVGVVSQNDLFSLQRLGVREISAQIAEAGDVEGLKRAAGQIRALAEQMLRRGTGAEALTQLISTLNDLLTMRVIELRRAAFALPDVPMCWIALGSEGRFEQTLSTDQDNGMVFAPPEPAATEAVREALLPFARAVNQDLDACGFPLCTGDIMAGNASWCLSVDEWRARFTEWIVSPTPEALLNATIFFDFRPLWGDHVLAEDLREWLARAAPTNTMFLVHMAGLALTCRPPIGTLRDFVLDNSDKAFPRTINLKMFGSRPFVDAARVYSLVYGVRHTNTVERLRLAAPSIGLQEDAVEAMVQGFHFVQMLRLRRQIDPATPPGGANRVNPYRLNDMDRRMLKEAFRQARRLQTRLQLRYNL
jgi:CBS domain-containing protein